MKKGLLLAAATAFLAIGCASSPTTKTSKSVAPKKVDGVKFSRKYAAIDVKDYKSKEFCPTSFNNFDGKKWHDQVAALSICVKEKRWFRLHQGARILARTDVNNPWGAYFLSLHFENKKNFRAAQWMIENAIKKDQNYGLFHYQKGRLLWKELKVTEAIAALKKSVDLDEDLLHSHKLLGEVYFVTNRPKLAKKHFETVLDLNSSEPSALLGLAELSEQSQDWKKSAKYYQKHAQVVQNSLNSYMKLGEIYEIKFKDLSKAKSFYEKAQQKARANSALDFELKRKVKTLEELLQGQNKVAKRQPAKEKK